MNFTCPDCGGAWLRNFTFDHDPANCQLRTRDDSTQYADFERLQTTQTFDRRATDTEIELYEAITGHAPTEAEFYDPADSLPTAPVPMTTVTQLAPGVHHRVIAGLDPDVMEAA